MDCQTLTVDGAAGTRTRSRDPGGRLAVALMTPWDQRCGNAEYAKRLAVGLERFADVIPFEMRSFIDAEDRGINTESDRYFADLVRRVNRSNADLVHIQHEFCFFARRVGPANRRFEHVMRRLDKPVVVSLHTWLKRMTRKRRNRGTSRFFEGLFHRLRNHSIGAGLGRAEAIVLHSHDTYKHFVEAFPRLRQRTHVIPIPIERVPCDHVTPAFVKQPHETWIVVPGFVSRYKGHRHLLEALKKLPEDYTMVVAGGTHPKDKTSIDYWIELIEQADAASLQSRVLFTGFLGDSATQGAVLSQADVFVLPYDEVGQSGSAVLADSLSYDRPVITSRARSMFVYRMDRETAFSSIAVDVADADRLAATIERCARDEDLHHPETRGQRASVRERFSLERTRVAYENVYRQALAGAARAA